MKTILALILSTSVCFSAGINVSWTNGDNPTATQTIVYYGVTSGVYTNSVTVPFTQTTVTITNLVAGVRYYVAAKHTDGSDQSDYSNEANAKTKLNPPKNASAVAQ